MCASHNSLRKNTASITTDANGILPNVVPRKTPSNPNQLNEALMKRLKLLIRTPLPTTYSTFSGFNHFAALTFTGGTIFLIQRLVAWIFTVVQIITTENIHSCGKKKRYGGIFGKVLQLATDQIIGENI